MLNDCVSLAGGPFGVNPMMTVQVVRAGLPTFFSRIWGNTGNSVSATATAEAFNPSASDFDTNGGTTRSVTPVQPSCVKPWMVPNLDPGNPAEPAQGTRCPRFMTLGNGAIHEPRHFARKSSGVIGETFNLIGGLRRWQYPVHFNQPQTTPRWWLPHSWPIATPPQTSSTFQAKFPHPLSLCHPALRRSRGKCRMYSPAVAGCDQTTAYQCGVLSSHRQLRQISRSRRKSRRTASAGDTAPVQ